MLTFSMLFELQITFSFDCIPLLIDVVSLSGCTVLKRYNTPNASSNSLAIFNACCRDSLCVSFF